MVVAQMRWPWRTSDIGRSCTSRPAQDGDAVACLLNLREHVRRKYHGASGVARFANQRKHNAADGGVEVRSRLVENKQRHIRGERRGKRQFLPHRQSTSARCGDKSSPRRSATSSPRVGCAWPRRRAKSVSTSFAHAANEPHIAGNVRHTGMHGHTVTKAIAAADRGGSPRGLQETHEQAD